ncbi:Smoothelin, partial [Cinara cedri]
MATKLGSDISLIQHEDVLLEMLRQTEDFGKKKEIRMRIHELRKQRLNEFYTREMIQIKTTSKRSSTESITDQKFMTMKTKVIGDSESPTEVYQKKSNANTNFPVKEVKSKKKFNIVKQSTIINRTSTIIPQDKSPVPDVKPKEKSPVKLRENCSVKEIKPSFEDDIKKIDIEVHDTATETLERSTTKSPERKLLIDFKVDTSRNYHEQYTATTTKQRTTTTAETEFGVTTKPALVPKDTPTIIQSTKIHITDDEMQIEKIFDLQILEIMLEKIAGYDRKRRIIAQIRIVKRQLEPSKIGKDTTNTISRVSKTVRDGSPAKLQKRNNSKTVHEVDFVNSNQIDNKSVGGKNTKDKFESILKIFRQESFDQNSRRSSKESNGYEKIEGSPQSTPRSNFVRGDSIKALQHKFQQATVSSSFKQNNSTKSKSPNTVRQTKVQTVINKLNLSKTDDSIFLHNNSKATGIQDHLCPLTSEDIEARALSNKILGASVIPHGMEQGEMSPISNQTATKSSASLINQVEKQRAQ